MALKKIVMRLNHNLETAASRFTSPRSVAYHRAGTIHRASHFIGHYSRGV